MAMLLFYLGWSPAPFVSSRSQKASQHQQRPEDYMDDEVWFSNSFKYNGTSHTMVPLIHYFVKEDGTYNSLNRITNTKYKC